MASKTVKRIIKKVLKKHMLKSQHEHILDLPDTYIGSIEQSEMNVI